LKEWVKTERGAFVVAAIVLVNVLANGLNFVRTATFTRGETV
jgi:hypothetical protein